MWNRWPSDYTDDLVKVDYSCQTNDFHTAELTLLWKIATLLQMTFRLQRRPCYGQLLWSTAMVDFHTAEPTLLRKIAAVIQTTLLRKISAVMQMTFRLQRLMTFKLYRRHDQADCGSGTDDLQTTETTVTRQTAAVVQLTFRLHSRVVDAWWMSGDEVYLCDVSGMAYQAKCSGKPWLYCRTLCKHHIAKWDAQAQVYSPSGQCSRQQLSHPEGGLSAPWWQGLEPCEWHQQNEMCDITSLKTVNGRCMI